MNKKIACGLTVSGLFLILGLVLCLSLRTSPDDGKTANAKSGESAAIASTRGETTARGRAKTRLPAAVNDVKAPKAEFEDEADDVPPPSAEEMSEAEEEKLVDAFDALTDTWMEPASNGVSMADVKRFNEQFRKVPMSRRDECLHRALNLVPDENVMLLAGILMDKSYGVEILDTVYGDVLNRAEEVKKPILQQIFKDKTHPCWADTAWILDVTDELPKRGTSASATGKEGGNGDGGENETTD